ncbi:hypothetical protein AB1Y20_022533 [Prymnesium parvum]|uniref:Uncharacterized protein n=1 Tax=Prymnesium parvum TaxID=97485 RepID=A0AB34JJ94_PRYPA
MSHKLGSATKVGDALPNVEVHIGFAGLSPTNAKMTGDLAKGKTLWVVAFTSYHCSLLLTMLASLSATRPLHPLNTNTLSPLSHAATIHCAFRSLASSKPKATAH